MRRSVLAGLMGSLFMFACGDMKPASSNYKNAPPLFGRPGSTVDAKALAIPGFSATKDVTESDLSKARGDLAPLPAPKVGDVMTHAHRIYNSVKGTTYYTRTGDTSTVLSIDGTQVTRKVQVNDDATAEFAGRRFAVREATCTGPIDGSADATCTPPLEPTDAYKAFMKTKQKANIETCSFRPDPAATPEELKAVVHVTTTGTYKLDSNNTVPAVLTKDQRTGLAKCGDLDEQKMTFSQFDVQVANPAEGVAGDPRAVRVTIYQNKDNYFEWYESEGYTPAK